MSDNIFSDSVLKSAVPAVVKMLIETRAHKAVKYLSQNFVVRAVAPLYNGKVRSRAEKSTTIVLSIGKPNFRERRFIKTLVKAKEPFPVRNIIIKMPPVPRKAAKKKR